MRPLELIAAVSVAVLLWSCSTQPHNEVLPASPIIASTIEFENTALKGLVAKPQLAGWWKEKLKIGSDEPDAYEFLTINTNGQDKRIRVETCSQYTNAIHQGAFALTTFDMTMESWFQRAVGALRFMEQAKSSSQQLPDDFLTRLPVSLLGWHGSDEEARINADTRTGTTLKDYARLSRVKHLKLKQHHLSFQNEGQDFSIEELARGDSDGDGFEDALVFVTWHYREGSGFGYELIALSPR